MLKEMDIFKNEILWSIFILEFAKYWNGFFFVVEKMNYNSSCKKNCSFKNWDERKTNIWSGFSKCKEKNSVYFENTYYEGFWKWTFRLEIYLVRLLFFIYFKCLNFEKTNPKTNDPGTNLKTNDFLLFRF